MTLSEMANILGTMASYDGREVSVQTVEAWHALAGHLNHEQALDIVIRHYRRTGFRMMPVDLINGSIPSREEWMHRP